MADPNKSSTGGCLRPIPTLGLDEEGEELAGLDEGLLDGPEVLVGSIDGKIAVQRMNRFLQSWLVCVTGLEGPNVRPRWQPEGPNLPAAGTSWAAFGMGDATADTFPAIVHRDDESDDDGFDELLRNEEFDVLVSFYGPRADAFSRALRDNAQIAQNRALLGAAAMGLIETSGITTLPSLVKSRWKYRCDITVRIRWLVQKQYRVQNLLSAVVDLRIGDAVDGGTIDEEITTVGAP